MIGLLAKEVKIVSRCFGVISIRKRFLKFARLLTQAAKYAHSASSGSGSSGGCESNKRADFSDVFDVKAKNSNDSTSCKDKSEGLGDAMMMDIEGEMIFWLDEPVHFDKTVLLDKTVPVEDKNEKRSFGETFTDLFVSFSENYDSPNVSDLFSLASSILTPMYEVGTPAYYYKDGTDSFILDRIETVKDSADSYEVVSNVEKDAFMSAEQYENASKLEPSFANDNIFESENNFDTGVKMGPNADATELASELASEMESGKDSALDWKDKDSAMNWKDKKLFKRGDCKAQSLKSNSDDEDETDGPSSSLLKSIVEANSETSLNGDVADTGESLTNPDTSMAKKNEMRNSKLTPKMRSKPKRKRSRLKRSTGNKKKHRR